MEGDQNLDSEKRSDVMTESTKRIDIGQILTGQYCKRTSPDPMDDIFLDIWVEEGYFIVNHGDAGGRKDLNNQKSELPIEDITCEDGKPFSFQCRGQEGKSCTVTCQISSGKVSSLSSEGTNFV
eukprot:TRINITY_DN12324_c0_g1_i2.p1 TRINITY_DN12324_c0_g1~~TRINITY_DN12324_c0_g1_i2.p1  ORF type:complete len:124 (+),score=24.18 TRINITY_DN12324_c0_g1_i2:75-446(+)